MKVLVAEDNKESRYLLEMMLKGYGHEVTAVANGVEALEQALAQPPDIIVSDIMMPKMDGFQLCQECKQNEQLKNIPFIFYTATYTSDEDEKFALSLGANAFILKPTEPDILVQMLSEEFEKAKSKPLAPDKIVPLEPSLYLTEYNKRIVAKLEDKVAQLDVEITERKRAEERIRHLNSLLKAIRHVNQLVVVEKDRTSLLHKTCDALVQARGYDGAWLGFLGNDKAFATVVGSGLGEGVSRFSEHVMAGDHPPCIRVALDQKGDIVIVDKSRECGDCFFKSTCKGKEAAIIRVERADRFFGLLAILFTLDVAVDEEEKGLLKEVAGDIAFGLHDMEMEKERKRAEKALRESEQKLRNIFENSTNLFYSHTTEHVLTYLSPQVENILGYTVEEALIKWTELASDNPINEEGFRKTVEAIKTGKIQPPYELELLHKNGAKVKVEVREAPVVKNGKTIAIVGALTNITERKMAEEKLKKSDERYRTLVESSTDAILMMDNERKIVSCNQGFLDLFGYKKHEVEGKSIRIIHQSDECFNSFGKRIYSVIEKIGFFKTEWEFKRKDGSIISVETVISAIKSPDGAITGYVSIIRDITERKQAEEEKVKLEIQLHQAQKMEAIGTLSGGIAHDFNNILTIIIGNARLALMDVGKDGSVREEIEEIRKAGERAASLTRQLLAFSRKQIIRPEILDLNELLTDIEKMIGRLIGEDVEMLTIPGPALWKVEADPGQMEQVIMNLAINARDAMPKGGKLTVETANMDLDGNYFRQHGIEEQPGPYVMLAVNDIGIGIDKETQKQIFDPFFTTKETGKGTGLGLSTVYGIVKQHNGFIWVYSEPGQGSTFKIYLPKAKGDVASEKKGQHLVTELGGSETVLIVEDDDSLRKFARTVLKQRGYKVLEAENGEDALRVSEAHDGSIELMITDVVMPKMGGKEVAERLQPLYPQMKVIYMSGYTDNAIVHHGVLAPGLNFFEKPFTPEGLARKVREALDIEN